MRVLCSATSRARSTAGIALVLGLVAATPTAETVNGTLSAFSAAFDRQAYQSVDLNCTGIGVDSPNDNVHYMVIPIVSPVPQIFECEVLPAETTIGDTYLFLYCDFDPASPELSLLAGDDDGGTLFLSAFTAADAISLEANTVYDLVLTTYSSGITGTFGISLSEQFTLADEGNYESCFEMAPVPIPDNTPSGASASVFMPATPPITDLDVSLEITHTWVGDLVVSLEHADTGTTVTLFDRPGVPESSFGCSNNNLSLHLDDDQFLPKADDSSVCDPVGTTASYPTGTFRPASPLSAFDGENAGGTWRLIVSDNAGADLGTIDNWCLVATTVPLPRSDLAVVKSDGVTEVEPGQTVTYTVTVTNAGPEDALGAHVTDAVPLGVANMAWTATTAAGASVANTFGMGSIDETVDIPVGGVVTYEVMAEVAIDAAGQIVNTATVFIAEDPNLTNNMATDTDIVLLPDLSITQASDATVALAGQEFHIVLTVSNDGSTEATGVQVTETLDPSIMVLDDSCGGAASGDAWMWDIGSLAVGESISCELHAVLLDCGSIQNTATVSVDQADQSAADNANTLEMNASLNLLGDPSFEASLPNPVWEGNSPTQNPGNPNIVVSVPPIVRTGTRMLYLVESASAEQMITEIPVSHEATLRLHAWNITVGASPEDVIRVFLDGTEVAAVNNGDPAFTGGYAPLIADVSAWADGTSHEVRIVADFNNPPFNTQFLIDDVTLSVCPAYTDVSLTKTASATTARAGDPLGYTLEVTNWGPGVARDSVVLDTLPLDVVPTGITTTQGTAEVMGDIVSFELGGVTPPLELLTNGSFETRDLTGWTVIQTPITDEFLTSAVYASGTLTYAGPPIGFEPSAPLDGSYSYMNGFDGWGPFTYDLYQEVRIPPNAIRADLSWAEELQWDLFSFCLGCVSREYEVTVQPAGGGAPLAVLFSEVAAPGTTRIGSGEVLHTVDLLSLGPISPGDTVRLNWHESIPENFTGPAQFELDAVSLIATTTPTTVTMTIQAEIDPSLVSATLINVAEVLTPTFDLNPGNNIALASTEVVAPDVTASPVSLDFGVLDIGDDPPAVRSLSIGNVGTADLMFTGAEIVISGPGSSELTITADTGQSVLSPGATRELTIEFDPATVGDKSSDLIITTDDPDEPTLIVPLAAFALQLGPTGRTTAEIVAYLLGLITGPLADFDVNTDGTVDAADVVANIEAINNP